MNGHDDVSGGSDPLAVAESLLADDDIAGLIRHLRTNGDQLPLTDVARVLRAGAQVSGFDDLAEAAADVVTADADPTERAQALFDFGYACVERGIAFLAIRPLSAAVELEPQA